MKLKTLKKKISKLEARLREGPQKLARLKRKLEALAKANAAKVTRRTAARPRKAIKPSQPAPKRSPHSKARSRAKPANTKRSAAATKVKRKLNLSPERRAQLAAAMKARWAAKKAATGANPQSTSPDGSGSEDRA